MGMWIIDNANLEELSETCKEKNRWEFMINIGPLRIVGGTGSPVNPIAIF
jgi:kynurenine formamidase